MACLRDRKIRRGKTRGFYDAELRVGRAFYIHGTVHFVELPKVEMHAL